jgi:crotonobetainyl-CoA:carnitine CoA-transferase CaiB-like acyl-CoA transferase
MTSRTQTKSAHGSGPLAGLKVIDLTTVVMGPVSTQVLADYGADVIKVEPPEGDVMRLASPMRNPGMGAMYLQANRNKRSIVLDVKSDEGKRALLKLVADADIFIHNIRPAAMKRAGLGPDDIRSVNGNIIYVSLIGYGEGGAYAGRPAYDDLIQGVSSIPALYSRASGEAPQYVPLTMADRICGISAVHAVLAAVIFRSRTGKGQAIEVPMFETMAQFVLGDHMGGRTFEPQVGDTGYPRLLARDRRPYRTSDGYVCVLIYTNKQWRAFFDAIGTGTWTETEQHFAAHDVRAKSYNEVYRFLAGIFVTRSTDEWMKLLREQDIPHAPMNDVDSMIDDEHLRGTGFFKEMEHPSEGRIRLPYVVSRWSESQPELTRHPPKLGENSAEILAEAGYSHVEIERLCADGVTVDGRNVYSSE